MRKQLTKAMIDKLAAPAAGRLEIFDAIVPGLAVRVTSAGAKSFVLRGRVRGNPSPIRLTIGDARGMDLAKARQAASDALQAMRAGNDPREQRKTEAAKQQRERKAAEQERARERLTFEALIEAWSAERLSLRRPRYAAEAVRAIRHGLPGLLNRPADQIVREDARAALRRIVKAGHRVTAGRTTAYARACFAWAMTEGEIAGLPFTVASNPFAGLPIDSGTTERERVLSDTEIAEIWAAANTLNYPFGSFFQLAILTLQRRAEVAGMRWSEIAEDLSCWRMPGARMKNGKPHDVHLSEPARAVLRSLPRLAGSDLVFTTGRRRGPAKDSAGAAPISGFSQGKRYLDAAIIKARADAAAKLGGEAAAMDPWCVHDFRRTGVTTLAALGFDSIVVDKLLAHQPTKLRGVASVYQRHDFARERAAALDVWAGHVTGIEADNVLPMRAAR